MLSDDGVMLVSVPYLNPLRTLKWRLGWYRASADVQSFYQYAFAPDEMISLLAKERFMVVDSYAYDSLKGIRDEFPAVRRILGMRGIGWRLEDFLRTSPWARRSVAHMMMFVCRKKGTDCGA